MGLPCSGTAAPTLHLVVLQVVMNTWMESGTPYTIYEPQVISEVSHDEEYKAPGAAGNASPM